jgi:hypothetical protein
MKSDKLLPLNPLERKPLPPMPQGGKSTESRRRPPKRTLVDAEEKKAPAIQPLRAERRAVTDPFAGNQVRTMTSFREHLLRPEEPTQDQLESSSAPPRPIQAPFVPRKSRQREVPQITRSNGRVSDKPSAPASYKASVHTPSSPATASPAFASSPTPHSLTEPSPSPLAEYAPVRPLRRMRASAMRSSPSIPQDIGRDIFQGDKGKGKLPSVDAFQEVDSSGLIDSPPREMEEIRPRRGPERIPEYRNSGVGSKAELVNMNNEPSQTAGWSMRDDDHPTPYGGEKPLPQALAEMLAGHESEESKGDDRSPATTERARSKAMARLDASFIRQPTPSPAPEVVTDPTAEFTAQEIGAHSTPRATRIPKRTVTWAPSAMVKEFQTGEEKQSGGGLRNIFHKVKPADKEAGTELTWNHGYFDLMNRAHVAMGECVDRSLKTVDRAYQAKMAVNGHVCRIPNCNYRI